MEHKDLVHKLLGNRNLTDYQAQPAYANNDYVALKMKNVTPMGIDSPLSGNLDHFAFTMNQM